MSNILISKHDVNFWMSGFYSDIYLLTVGYRCISFLRKYYKYFTINNCDTCNKFLPYQSPTMLKLRGSLNHITLQVTPRWRVNYICPVTSVVLWLNGSASASQKFLPTATICKSIFRPLTFLCAKMFPPLCSCFGLLAM